MTPLERARAAYEGAAWLDAYQAYSTAERSMTERNETLTADDLWRYAMAAHLTGHDEAFFAALDRAHDAYRATHDHAAAARCAFWLGFRLVTHGEMARGSGWLARAQRVLEHVDGRCVEQGYLLLPQVLMLLNRGAFDEAFALAARAREVAEEFHDADLHAFALHAQGLARLRQARVAEGLSLLDEAMLAVANEASFPLVTGIVYCSVIAACRSVYALERAAEWTHALSAWCDRQPGLVPYAGQCMVHRAEILQLRGSWEAALEEARSAHAKCEAGDDRAGAGAALYAQAELLRLQGRVPEAERAYAEAAQRGRDPQPGLALLRAQQGSHETAIAAIRRALHERQEPVPRARLLPAMIEVFLGAGDVGAARDAVSELDRIATTFHGSALAFIAAHWHGAVCLAENDPATALAHLRSAWRGWQALEAEYETARTRELVGLACASLGDSDTASIELDAARVAYRSLGAVPDLARLDGGRNRRHGLTPRELEVLRLVVAGGTNKAIAAELGLSERTVERHLSNVYDKIGVSSRAAATAFAFEHGLA
jgi:DNA-binding CsgD family transcriptional regulator/tetratricopeptide (TPR) repeat protein